MLYLNMADRWNYEQLDEVDGVIVLPCGTRRIDMYEKAARVRNILLDPQLYLSHIKREECIETFDRLLTYPCFSSYSHLFAAAENSAAKVDLADLETVVAQAIGVQQYLRCAGIILPCTLITGAPGDLAEFRRWVEVGFTVAKGANARRLKQDVQVPVLASLVLSEGALSALGGTENGSCELKKYVDILCRQQGINGVYLAILRENQTHPLVSTKAVNCAYSYLVKVFAESGMQYVFPNFADVFGLALLAQGASAVITGAHRNARYLTEESFKTPPAEKNPPAEGLLPSVKTLPFYFSHKVLGEFAVTDSLAAAFDGSARLKQIVADEYTRASEPLLRAITRGEPLSKVIAWQPWDDLPNMRAAHSHFIISLARMAAECDQLPLENQYEWVRAWLFDARDYQRDLKACPRIGEREAYTLAPIDEWIDAIEYDMT